jgi:peptide-methionine (R)-S-oxide reductase
MAYKVEKTEAEWRAQLTPEEYHVLREKGTERPFVGEYTDLEVPGTYFCRACHAKLFTGNQKFHSGCGWPSFYAAMETGAVEEHVDTSYGMRRIEITCATCGSHMGHVFNDAPRTPTGLRYCINSISLTFEPDEKGVPVAE